MVALGNDTTILQGRRCVRVHSGIDLVLDIAQRVDPGDDLAEFGAAAALGLLAQAGQALTGLRHGIDLFGRGRAVDRAGHHTLQISDVMQFFD